MNTRILDIYPVTLTGEHVRLEPLGRQHIADLAIAGKDEEIWQYMLYGNVATLAEMDLWVSEMLLRQGRGADLPFAVINLSSGQAIGATRYMEVDRRNCRLEIGGTWYGLAYQRTAVNTECKYLLLRHAFETLGVIRVQFKTDARNERSQRALERLGAVKEGVLRNHIITPDGFIRDSVYYSILPQEWPVVKERLEGFLKRPAPE